MRNTHQLKTALHQFLVTYTAEEMANVGRINYDFKDFLERVRQSDWIAQIKALLEQYRIALLWDACVTDPP